MKGEKISMTAKYIFRFIMIVLFVAIFIIVYLLLSKKCNECKTIETTLPKCDKNCVQLSIVNSDPSELFSAPVFRVYTDQIVDLSKLPRCFMTTNKGIRELFIAFAYTKTGLKGQIGLGFDQYAIVFANPNPQYERDLVTNSVELFFYTDVNYWSFNWNNKQGVRIFITCKNSNETSMNTWSYQNGTTIIPDPFKAANSTIGCYLTNSSTENKYVRTEIKPSPLSGEEVIKRKDLPIFRIDQQTGGNLSKYGFLDGWRAGECFNTYLFGPIFVPLHQDFTEYDYGIIRIPVPNVYTGPYCPLDQDLDLNYFSLSTSYDPNLKPEELQKRVLPFWTVNGRMMKDNVNENGCSYVIWMPVEDIKSLSIYNPTDPMAPILQFNVPNPENNEPMLVNAFILGKSDYCWIFRYRTPNPNWEGNPDNAHCSLTTFPNPPIQQKELNNWLPIIAGTSATSLDEFLSFIPTQTDLFV